MSAEDLNKRLESIFVKALRPFTRNKNTGNVYEIAVLFDLLRKMGVTNEILDAHTSMLNTIISYNNKQSDNIRKIIDAIRHRVVGEGLVVDGQQIKDILNVTQDDEVGTGDIIVVTNTGQNLTISVCLGKAKKNGGIEKVLTNPSARRFKCTDADIGRMRRIGEKAVDDYKRYYTDKYGANEKEWPTGLRTTIATDACNQVAIIVAERFEVLSKEDKDEVFDDILRIDNNKLPANYLAMIHGKNYSPLYYKFDSVKMRGTWTPKLIARGIYLDFMNGTTKIGQTQVKFNNGIYHNGKTSSLSASWNASFDLTDLFKMSKVQVVSAPHTE